MANRHEVAQEVDHHLYADRRFVADPVGALPATPTAGRVVYLTTDGTLYWADGAAWNPVASGSPGPDGWVAFAFGTASPLTLQALAAGAVVEFALVVIETVFDDPTATLKVGTVATPDLVLGTGEIKATAIGQYASDIAHEVAVPEFLKLTISPGASTQGAGHVLFRVRS